MKYLLVCLISLLLTGCGTYGNEYDGLMVVDGNGRKLLLRHNVGDTYFITDLDADKVDKSKNYKINEKLKGDSK